MTQENLWFGLLVAWVVIWLWTRFQSGTMKHLAVDPVSVRDHETQVFQVLGRCAGGTAEGQSQRIWHDRGIAGHQRAAEYLLMAAFGKLRKI